MTRYERLKALFAQATELDENGRRDLLAELDDDALRAELVDLLEADSASADFLEVPAVIDVRDARLERGTRLGRYEIVEHIGDGAVGVVYRARDPDLDRDVAIKVLHAAPAGGVRRAPERLVREGQAVAKLAHPNVVSIFDVGIEGDDVFIAMELVDGPSLARWRADNQTSGRETVELMVQAGRGLAAAHEAGISHGDFKPDNLLVGSDGRVRVADFGLASPSDASASDGLVAGTPAFMAPEAFGGQHAGPVSDQFSFFATLYSMLYGTSPFRGDDLDSLSDAVRKNHRRPVPDKPRVARAVRRAIERGLAVDRERRFATMDEALEALETAIRPKRPLVVGAALIAAGAVAVAVVATQRSPQDSCARSAMPSVWTEARDELKTAFDQRGTPAMFAAFESVVKRYEGELAAVERDACVRRRDRLDSAPILEARDRCIAGRRVAIATALGAIAKGSARSVGGAIDSLDRLTQPAACADSAGLASYAVPNDPDKRAQFFELEEQLAEAEALGVSGDRLAARPKFKYIAERAESIGASALRARALQQLGWLTSGSESIPVLRTAALAAAKARDDFTAARAWRLVFAQLTTDHENSGRLDELEPLIPMTDAIVERSGDSQLQLLWLGTKGYFRGVQHDQQAALDLYMEKLRLAEAEFGPDSREAGIAAGSVGDSLKAIGRLEQATAYYARGLELTERHYGQGHPTLAEALAQMTQAARWGNELDKALEYSERAAAISKRAFGEESGEYARRLTAVATSKQGLGRHDDAIADARRAAALTEKVLGTESVDTGIAWTMLGQILNEAGDNPAALEAYDKAIEVYRNSVGEKDPQFAIVLYSAAEIHRAEKSYDRALGDLAEARKIFVATLGPSHQFSRVVAHSIASAHLDAGAPSRALPFAVDALNCSDCDALAQAHMKFTLARTLRGLGRDKKRARTLAMEAKQTFTARRGSAPSAAKALDQIETFLGDGR